ncbi:MAG: PQQ-dependent sugar dehydrogenase [Bryobacteraceae bacterium]
MRNLYLCLALALTARAQDEVRLTLFAQGVTAPTDIQHAGDGSGRMFFVQQTGQIRVFKNGALLSTPFLDIATKVFANGECGLVGLAFPPGYATKRYFYVLYSDPTCHTRTLSRYNVSANPDVADPASERVVMTIAQTDPVHLGGQMRFGRDGYLYVSSGDGADVQGPGFNAQNRFSLLGKILRIDTESDLSQYRIPPGNPFVAGGGLPEIWAYGFRNPWRFSFDRDNGDMWIGEVGGDAMEEVDYLPAGASGQNFGWNVVEGTQCYPPAILACDTTGMTPPIRTYAHGPDGEAIIGGFVYRGTRYPALRGTYVYGDFESGRIWGIVKNGSTFTNRLLVVTPYELSVFGEDEQGELYVGQYFTNDGNIYRIESLVSLPSLGTPTITAPTANQVLQVSGVTFQWSAVANATGYDLRIMQGATTVFQNTVAGGNTVSTVVTLNDGAYTFQVRACAGGFTDAQCGSFASVAFSVAMPPTLGTPTITAPVANQVVLVSGVTFQWSPVTNATGYDLRVRQGASTLFQGTLAGGNATSTLVTLNDGSYTFLVRACAGGFTDPQCGSFASVAFSVAQPVSGSRPVITSPANAQEFTTSTQTFSWASVAGAASYEIQLSDMANGGAVELSMSVAGSPPPTSTIFSMRGSTDYRLLVRACTAACGDWSDPVRFKVTLPPVPTQAPAAPSCTLTGSVASCSWNAVSGADYFTLQAVQPTAGPGGGALTVAGLRTTQQNGAVTLPPGATSMFVAGCNGNGCGPYSAPTPLTPAGSSPASPLIGNPVNGSALDGPDVFFSWNRVSGDNGSNTVYRLYVQDFSRAAPALDVLTRANFWSAKFRGGGNRYDVVVVANPGTPGAVTGPASAFLVRGASAASPTMAQPRHQAQNVTLSVAAGNVQLGWTPVPGATLYEYLVSVQGQPQPAVRGITPGLIVQVPLAANATFYSGIVRACPAGQTCNFGSDAGWGPWSSAPGQGGVTNFLVQ